MLTGESVSDAIGTFSYTDGPDGTVIPEKSWVDEYIRTEEVPILGTVTCNKGMLPQLRGALSEIVQLGLADKINPDEYAGCYYPRYINRSPEYGLSLHSWGIAVDLNVPGNQRGTVGEMDRTRGHHLQEVGLRLGRRLELHRPDALRDGQGRPLTRLAGFWSLPARRPASGRSPQRHAAAYCGQRPETSQRARPARPGPDPARRVADAAACPQIAGAPCTRRAPSRAASGHESGAGRRRR